MALPDPHVHTLCDSPAFPSAVTSLIHDLKLSAEGTEPAQQCHDPFISNDCSCDVAGFFPALSLMVQTLQQPDIRVGSPLWRSCVCSILIVIIKHLESDAHIMYAAVI